MPPAKPNTAAMNVVKSRRATASTQFGNMRLSAETRKAIQELGLSPTEWAEFRPIMEKANRAAAAGDTTAWVDADIDNQVDEWIKKKKGPTYTPEYAKQLKATARMARVDARFAASPAPGVPIPEPKGPYEKKDPAVAAQERQQRALAKSKSTTGQPSREEVKKARRDKFDARASANQTARDNAAKEARRGKNYKAHRDVVDQGPDLKGAAEMEADIPVKPRQAGIKTEAGKATRAARVAKVAKGRGRQALLKTGGKLLGGVGLALTAAEILSMVYESGPGQDAQSRKDELMSALSGTREIEEVGDLRYEENLNSTLNANDSFQRQSDRQDMARTADHQRLMQMLSQDRAGEIAAVAVKPRPSLADIMAAQGVV